MDLISLSKALVGKELFLLLGGVSLVIHLNYSCKVFCLCSDFNVIRYDYIRLQIYPKYSTQELEKHFLPL